MSTFRNFFLVVACLFSKVSAAQLFFYLDRLQPAAAQTSQDTIKPAVSGDGKVVAFESGVTWTPTQAQGGLFAYFLQTGNVLALSTNSSGVPLNGNSFEVSLSDNARYALFATQATNFSPVVSDGQYIVRKDLLAGTLTLASTAHTGAPINFAREPSLSANGQFAVFRTDAANVVNGIPAGTYHVYVKNIGTGGVEIIDLRTDNTPATTNAVLGSNTTISADGRFVVFETASGNMVPGVAAGSTQVYVRDRSSASNELISRSNAGAAGDSGSDYSSISPNGRFIAFRSFATNLGVSVSGVAGVFVRDRQAGTTRIVNLPVVNGEQANGCRENAIANNGSLLLKCTFSQSAAQIFFDHPPGLPRAELFSRGVVTDDPGNLASTSVALSAWGTTKAFDSRASNILDGDTNGMADVFVQFIEVVTNEIHRDGFE